MFDKNSIWGLGTWGDPKTVDHTVKDGGFRNFKLAYPAPHILRRQLQLQAFKDVPQSPLVPEPARYLNNTLSYANIDIAMACKDLFCLQTHVEGDCHFSFCLTSHIDGMMPFRSAKYPRCWSFGHWR